MAPFVRAPLVLFCLVQKQPAAFCVAFFQNPCIFSSQLTPSVLPCEWTLNARSRLWLGPLGRCDLSSRRNVIHHGSRCIEASTFCDDCKGMRTSRCVALSRWGYSPSDEFGQNAQQKCSLVLIPCPLALHPWRNSGNSERFCWARK